MGITFFNKKRWESINKILRELTESVLDFVQQFKDVQIKQRSQNIVTIEIMKEVTELKRVTLRSLDELQTTKKREADYLKNLYEKLLAAYIHNASRPVQSVSKPPSVSKLSELPFNLFEEVPLDNAEGFSREDLLLSEEYSETKVDG